MKLSELPTSQLLAAFRAPEPTPGGGSAAALAGAIGASLLAMVAGLPKPNAADAAEAGELHAAGRQCTSTAIRLEALLDEDSEAYELVLRAFRMPKGTDEEKAARAAGIQRGLTAATEVPLEVMRRCGDALRTSAAVARLGNPNAASDVQVGIGLLKAGIRGAQQNVEINLASLKDAGYVARVRAESAALAAMAS